MASIARRPEGRWRPRYRDAAGKEHARHFDRVVNRPGDALAFPSPQGAVLRNRNARASWFDDAARAAGLPGLTPHQLRHAAASLAVAAGGNVKAVQRMLGHASAAMTWTAWRTGWTAYGARSADRLRTICGLNALRGYLLLKIEKRNMQVMSGLSEWRRGESNP